MFEFTKNAKKILDEISIKEAVRLNSAALEPEHIFLALLGEEDSVSVRILKYFGANIGNLKLEAENAVRRAAGLGTVQDKLPVSPEFRRVIDLAREEAVRFKNSYIGTEHLLLAVFRSGICAGINSLNRSGVDYIAVRNQVLRFLGVRAFGEKQEGVHVGGKAKADARPPALEEFAHDLTLLAREGRLDPVIGRTSEITRVVRILSRKHKNNPILIGEAGVGKTAIVEGLAQRICEGSVPKPLLNSKVYSLDMAAVVAGTKYRGEFEERLKRLVSEIKEKDKAILFIDEIHTIIGAGAAEGAIDAANILKPPLARGELCCIGATTVGEYRQHIEKDAALVRRFQSLFVEEPTPEQSVEILKGLRASYERHHLVNFSDEALEEAVVMSARYINDRFLPDKAIDLLDETGAKASLESCEKPKDIAAIENEIEEINFRKNELVQKQEYEQAAALRDILIEKKKVLENKLADWEARENDYSITVGAADIDKVISENTGIPVDRFETSTAERLLSAEKVLETRIVGQHEAVSLVARALRRSGAGLSNDKRPLGSFIFLGPTGVGKTELAKVLANFLFNNKKNLIRFDMSEYMEKHSVARLIGAPPGYIGHEEGGKLSEAVRRRPYSVVLFDEIEKAHPDVMNVLLQILDEAALTDSIGTTVSFKDTVIIMTSNAGARDYQKTARLGFDSQAKEDDKNERAEAELKRLFPPEFLNRVDEIVYFNKLEKKHAIAIIDIMLADIAAALLEKRKIKIEFSTGLKKFICSKGFSDIDGARNLRHIIRREVEDVLASELLKGEYDGKKTVTAFIKGNKVCFKTAGFAKTADACVLSPEEIASHIEAENIYADENKKEAEPTAAAKG